MKLSTLQPRIATLDVRRGSSIAVDRIRGSALTKIRDRILLRDEYCCRVCGRVSARELVVDHIVPLHLGGPESDENRQVLCTECHDAKSAAEERGRGGSNLKEKQKLRNRHGSHA
jgi:5-methylcytosine-specific restriction endonuclease McrA